VSTSPHRPSVPSAGSPAPSGSPAVPGNAGRPSNPARRLRWIDGLASQGVLALATLFATLLVGFIVVMNSYGRRQVADESLARLEETARATAEAVAARSAVGASAAPDLGRIEDSLADWRVRTGGVAAVLDAQGVLVAGRGPEAGSNLGAPADWIASFGAASPAKPAPVAVEPAPASAAPAEAPTDAAAAPATPTGGETSAGTVVPVAPATVVAPLAEPGARFVRRVDRVAGSGVADAGSLGFAYDVPAREWRVLLSAPRQQLNVVATRITRSLALLVTGVLAVVLLPMYLFLSGRLLKPVTTLADAAKIVGGGDLGIEVDIPGRNEIARLADSFNDMVRRLRDEAARVRRANEDLGQALRMTDTIMENVQEGLFLIDADQRIANRHSAVLADILGRRELAGASFPELLRSITTGETQDLTGRFLKLLFQAEKPDSVLFKINPLKEVETSFDDGTGRLRQKALSFRFERVREGGEIRYAMVTVSDVTARVQLARQLEQSRLRLERQAELLTSVLHVDPQSLREFIDSSYQQLEQVNRMLKEGGGEGLPRAEANRRLVDDIYRVAHSIKGTAGLLGIDFFADAAHRFETTLEGLRSRREVGGADFVPAVLELSQLLDSLVEVRDLLERLGGLASPTRGGGSGSSSGASDRVVSENARLRSQLQRFLGELAQRHAKRARLVFDLGEDAELPETWRAPLRDVFSQLLRNAVVHGIEPPAERIAARKRDEGEILISARRIAGQLEFTVRDDGRGLDYTKLAARAQTLIGEEPQLADRLIDRERNEWRLDALEGLVFHPRFSTADSVDGDAGRGVGLSAARAAVDALGGDLALRQESGRFCEFAFSLRVPPSAAPSATTQTGSLPALPTKPSSPTPQAAPNLEVSEASLDAEARG
jgi:signal transduction histidine kinase/HAMP domain-containing protein